MAECSEKPRVLILGGVGFVGRHLTSYLVKNQLTSKIRVVDKVPPGMGWLNEDHRAAFSQVEFTQAPGPETVNSQELEPEPELEPGSRPVPETKTSQEPGPWSTRLRPRHSAGRGRP